MNEFTFPSGLIYIGIVIVMVIIIAVLAMVNTNQKHEIEYLLSRRSGGKKTGAAGPEAERPEPPAICNIFWNYKDVVIPTMQAEIDGLKVDLKNAEIRYEIAQSTITKLRTGKGENQYDERS